MVSKISHLNIDPLLFYQCRKQKYKYHVYNSILFLMYATISKPHCRYLLSIWASFEKILSWHLFIWYIYYYHFIRFNYKYAYYLLQMCYKFLCISRFKLFVCTKNSLKLAWIRNCVKCINVYFCNNLTVNLLISDVENSKMTLKNRKYCTILQLCYIKRKLQLSY